MKKLILIAIVCFSLNAFAQDNKISKETLKSERIAKSKLKKKSAAANIDKRVERLAKHLDLSSEQREKVHALLKEQSMKNESERKMIKNQLASKKSINKESAMKKRLEMRETNLAEFNSKLKEILTETQYKNYVETTKKRQEAKQKVQLRKN